MAESVFINFFRFLGVQNGVKFFLRDFPSKKCQKFYFCYNSCKMNNLTTKTWEMIFKPKIKDFPKIFGKIHKF